jgi:hypothetical protein
MVEAICNMNPVGIGGWGPGSCGLTSVVKLGSGLLRTNAGHMMQKVELKMQKWKTGLARWNEASPTP